MVCETRLKPRQTIQQRVEEVRRAMATIDALIAARSINVVVDKRSGAIAFTVPDNTRDGLTDACIYRRIMAAGSAQAKLAIARAEQMAGRGVDKMVVGQGLHSHDGGRTWGRH